MTDIVIMLLFALGIKHVVCSFIVRPFILMFDHRLNNMSYPITGFLYVLSHVIGTLLVLISFTPFTPTILLASVVSALMHYLVDQTNNQLDTDEITNIIKTNTNWLNGFDQWIHGFIYLVMTALLLSFGIIS